MHSLWHLILWFLACMASDPSSVEKDRAIAIGLANVAYSAAVENETHDATRP